MKVQGFESIIGAAILGRTSAEEAVSKATILYLVQRAMFCPGCEIILDARSARLVTVTSEGSDIIGCPVCAARLVAVAERKGIAVRSYPSVEPVREAPGQCTAMRPDGSDRCASQARYRVSRKRGRKEYTADSCDAHARASVQALASVGCRAVTVRPIVGEAK
jgi:hypothetical protein